MNTRWLIQKITKKKVYIASGTTFTVLSLILLMRYLKSNIQIHSFPSIFIFNKLFHEQIIQPYQAEQKQTTDTPINYSALQSITQHRKLPAAMVDLDKFDRNTDKIAELMKDTGKSIRLATKSIRVPDLILRALNRHPTIFKSVMCYTVEEAEFLHSLGINDLLIAYPTVQTSDLITLRKLHESGANISLVLDNINQINLVDKAMKGLEKPLAIIIEIDMSLKILNDMIHLGVRRSPVRTIEDLRTILKASRSFLTLEIIGVMGYDAAVAGLTDNNPFKKMLNPLAQGVRKMVAVYAANLRAQIPAVFQEAGLPLKIFNAGGTGSINYNYSINSEPKTLLTDPAPTELTIGSGLLCSSLFDCYTNLKDSLYFEPSLFFALQVTRTSDPNYVTCFGGGYIASGEPGWDRVPTAILPKGLTLTNSEGCGEVQTPLIVNGKVTPLLGESVLFRPAKTGELAERFNQYLLLSNEQVVDEAKTYRGFGKCF